MKSKIKYYFIFLIHLTVIILALLSPLIFDWWMMVIGAVVFVVAGNRLNYCPLSLWQFGAKKSFVRHYLGKFGIKSSPGATTIVIRYITPAVLVTIALLRHIIIIVKD